MLSTYVASVFNIITNLCLVPIYLHYFDLDTYGAWLASGGIVAMLAMVDGGVTSVLNLRLSTHAGANDHAAFAKAAGSGWLITGLSFLSIVAVGLCLAPFAPVWVRAPAASVAALRMGFCLAVLGVAMSAFQANILTYVAAWQRTVGILVITSVGLFLACISTLVALWLGLGVAALGVAVAVRGSVGLGLSVALVTYDWRKRQLPRPSLARAEMALQARLTIPLILARMGSVAVANGVPAIVANSLGPSAAAVLAITTKAHQLAQSIANALAGGAANGLSHLAAGNSRRRVGLVLHELFELSATMAGAALGVAVALNGPFVALWAGAPTYGGLGLNIACCAAALVMARINLLGTILPALGIIGRPSLATHLENGLQVLLLFVLLPRFGLIGAPLATLSAVSASTLWLLPHFVGQWLEVDWRASVHLMARGNGAAVAMLAAGAGLAIVFDREGVASSWPRFFVAATLVLLGAAAAALSLNGPLREQLAKVWRTVRARARGGVPAT